jgi:hypothetical protein
MAEVMAGAVEEAGALEEKAGAAEREGNARQSWTRIPVPDSQKPMTVNLQIRRKKSRCSGGWKNGREDIALIFEQEVEDE